jgi:hypothetical protein
MIKLLTSDRDSLTLIETLEVNQSLYSPNWYNTLYKCFTNIRTIKLKKIYSEEVVKEYLFQHPELHIYTIIGHEPIISSADEEKIKSGSTTKSKIADRQRVQDEGEDYIDEFGRYVYTVSRIGTSDDIDLRYENVPEPELFSLEYIEPCIQKSAPIVKGMVQ